MVVKESGVPVDQELQFTDRLIGSNFSNYSSWHYRSTLLPLLHPQSPDLPVTCPKSSTNSPPNSPHTHSHRVCEEQLLKGEKRSHTLIHTHHHHHHMNDGHTFAIQFHVVAHPAWSSAYKGAY